MVSKSTNRNSNSNRNPNFWNRDLLEFIAQRLGEPQSSYMHGASVADVSETNNIAIVNQNPKVTQTASKVTQTPDFSQGVLNIGQIPEHFADKLKTVSSDIVDNLYILKVNTKNSLLHSILALLEESYKTAPWEKKEYMVSLFRGKIFSDIERNKALNDRLKRASHEILITKASIQKDIQEKYPTDLFKSFISVYFGVNLIIVSDKIETVPKTIDKCAPALLLYQYPFGNIAPIIQGNQDDQPMILSKSPILQALFGLPCISVADAKPLSGAKPSQSDIKPDAKPLSDAKLSLKPDAKPPINSEKEKKEKELLKLTLPEIQILCASHGIETKKPASKKDTWKNLTKKELVELLSDKYSI